jgi:hypothetical protein
MSLGLASASKPPSHRETTSDKIVLSASGSNFLILGEAYPRTTALGLGRVKTLWKKGIATFNAPELATISGERNFADKRWNEVPVA